MSSLFILQLLAPPAAMCLILIALHAYVGFHVLARGVLFVDLALAQIAALGATVAILLGFEHDSTIAYLFGMGASFLGAGLFAWTRGVEQRVPQEAVIGITYAVASALAILIVDRAPHGAEHIKEILVGNLLAVTWTEVVRDIPVYFVLGVFHFIFRERFLTISYRLAEARAKGWALGLWDFLFYVAFGMMITTSVRVAGVLLVFTYLIVPGVIAALMGKGIWRRLIIAWGFGVGVTLAGLWGSYLFDFPTGATIVSAFGATLGLVGLGFSIVPRLLARRRARAPAAVLLALLALGSTPARAESTDAASDVDLEAIARALGQEPAGQAGGPSLTSPGTAGGAPIGPPAGASLNPNVSAIFNVAGAYFRGAPAALSEDDPRETGFNQQELEVAFQAFADPYFRADLFLSIGGLDEFEVEEGYLTTLELPAGLQAKVGVFRSALGRQNGQHLEQLAFVNRPLLNPLLLGADGLRAPGAQLSYLLSFLPFFSTLYLEASSVGAPEEPDGPLPTFGGGRRRDLTYVAAWENFFELSDDWSLLLGANGAAGVGPGVDLESRGDDHRAWLFGGDLYLKWRPLRGDSLSRGVSLTLEYFARRLSQGDLAAGYGQLFVQLARQWGAAGRVDLVGGPGGDTTDRSARGALALTYKPTEFSSVRVQIDRAFLGGRDDTAVFLQVGAGIGAHGAHPF